VSRERYLAAYEPNYKIGDRAYLYGAVQTESDRFLGYDSRFSASAGGGFGAIRSPGLTLDLELGPAFRQTGFADDTAESALAARGRVDLDWKLTPLVTLSQDASAYLQNINSTVASTTALNARLFGPLSAQLSYAVQYESTPTEGRRTTDTTSRASLVYSF
jgi:putative salt-induced outer membrane protein